MLILPVYDLVNNKFIDHFFIEYRNTILEKIFPGIKFAVGSVASANDWNKKTVAASLDEGFLGYNLVGATGSRKHGHFLFAQAPKTLFVDYFGSNMNAVNYGSNLTTECNVVASIQPTILVVEDGNYRTGDCHGKVSPVFASQFGFAKNSCQFRLVSPDPKWVAKGTLVSSANLPEGIDLVLPTSSFKGNKVKPGIYKQNCWFGIKDIFQVGEVSLSFSVVQFLSWQTVAKDLLPQTIKRAKELASIHFDAAAQKTFMNNNMKDDCITQATQLDKFDQLLNHPYTQSKLDKNLAKEWRKIATGTAVKFNLSTCVPDDRLGHHECCIPGVPDGMEIIVFPYPCRWKYDIKVWKNRVLPSWTQEDVIVINHKTALELGRDFDGDRLPWALAEDYPNVATEIKTFGNPPLSDIKPVKQALDISLGQAASLVMENETGLITWLIAKANASGRDDIVVRLVPQLQLAVDSLKGSQKPNQRIIRQCTKALKADVPWLAQYKDPLRYQEKAIDSGTNTDTISLLNREVASIWLPRSKRITRKTAYKALYSVSPIDLQVAGDFVKGFSQKYNTILSEFSGFLSEAREREKEQCVAALFNQYKAACDVMDFRDRFQFFKAIWEFQHRTQEGNASLCMYLFADIVAVEFSDLRLKQFRVTKKYNCDFKAIGNIVQICQLVPRDSQYILVNQDGYSLGTLILNDNPQITGQFPISITDRGGYLDCEVIY